MRKLEECGLTKRERELVGLVYMGIAGRHAARMLKISLITMQNHLVSIYNKTGADSVVDILRRMHQEQL